ncbi:hypothetical protein GF068_11310 [Polyangium spumosum]|uniref:Tetratricopeptide repeat protein n=2 Tax=Polyangium spumosum TaxID=889282 RepID=A0A6N7PUL9_9BACT|nr:hypothetical protein [Polyangium spumosum]
MHEPNDEPSAGDEPELCWSCRENEATDPFAYRGGPITLVCARCLEWLRLRDELEQVCSRSLELTELGRFDEALACLDAFSKKSDHCDPSREFARGCARYRAMILCDAGRYAEAEQACEAWAQLGFRSAWERREHGLEKARVLVALGRPREALAAIEEALGHRDTYLLDIGEPLVALVELSGELGQPVDPKWRGLAAAVSEAYGIEMPAHDSLEKIMLALAETTKQLLPKRARDAYHVGAGEDTP